MHRNPLRHGVRRNGPVRDWKVMKVARAMVHEDTSQVAEYLSKNMGLDVLHSMLGNLDASLIPPANTEGHSPATRRHVDIASSTMTDLLVILGSFNDAANPLTLKPFMDDCWTLLVERRDEVARWILYFIPYSVASSSVGNILHVCVEVMMMMNSEHRGFYKEEIISAASTARIIIHLICLTHPRTQKVVTCRQAPFRGCSITEVWRLYLTVNASSHLSVVEQLTMASPATRRQVITALVDSARERTSQMCDRRAIRAASRCFFNLVSGTWVFPYPLWRTLNSRTFMAHCSKYLLAFAKEAGEYQDHESDIWLYISQSAEMLAMTAAVRVVKNPIEGHCRERDSASSIPLPREGTAVRSGASGSE
ncbi:hypothetical protein FA13DRAFT_170270 [Coprinellus micaceus]|uniref:Uncharacterized protein n=1 Tax=Coprinellus micaceus TaxID=71717 RepID=A0A4Y7SGY2_COPMI|nr:hypothetical protein FA13DRAFT_170270 [Coprinellus micaceus]